MDKSLAEREKDSERRRIKRKNQKQKNRNRRLAAALADTSREWLPVNKLQQVMGVCDAHITTAIWNGVEGGCLATLECAKHSPRQEFHLVWGRNKVTAQQNVAAVCLARCWGLPYVSYCELSESFPLAAYHEQDDQAEPADHEQDPLRAPDANTCTDLEEKQESIEAEKSPPTPFSECLAALAGSDDSLSSLSFTSLPDPDNLHTESVAAEGNGRHRMTPDVSEPAYHSSPQPLPTTETLSGPIQETPELADEEEADVDQ